MLKFRVVTTLNECRNLWNDFSKGTHLFDDWEYRSCLYDPKIHKLHFLAGFSDKEAVVVLPLWKNSRAGYLEWFGGEFPEGNVFFSRDDAYVAQALRHVKGEVWLPYIEESGSVHATSRMGEGNFSLNLNSYNKSLDKYMDSFNSKHKKNLKRDLKLFEGNQPKVLRNQIADFDRMMALNKARFTKNSFFTEKEFVSGLKRLLELALTRRELEMLSVHIGGKCEAAEAAIMHKGTYYVLIGGNNLDFDNIGKFLTVAHIRNAMESGAKRIDFLSSDCGWKRLWNMDETPLWEYSKD